MSFQKYKVKDNAFSTLLVWISASTTSLQVQAGQWDRFPSNNFIATLVEYEISWDETSPVVKREKILVSNNSTDTFVITRWFDWDVPVSFEAWDFIYLNVVSKIIEDIQDEATRLENEKLNKTWALRAWLTNWRLLLINWSWAETELALWTAWQVLISQWTTSNPIWQSPSVDIAWLSSTTSIAWTDDFIVRTSAWNRKITKTNLENNLDVITWKTATTTPIWSDTAVINTSAGNRNTTLLNLTKWLQEATETLKWTVERATNAQATAWTDTTRYITPKQAKDNYENVYDTINISRVYSAENGNVIYNHSLWRTPKQIKINWGILEWDINFGTYIAWKQWSVALINSWAIQSTSAVILWYANWTLRQTWIISNVTSTNFTITWTRNSSIANTGLFNISLIA